VRSGRTPEQVLSALDQELRHLLEQPVQEEELMRAVKQARAIFAYGSETVTNQAFWMGYAEMFANYSWFETYLQKLESVRAEDISRVARKFLSKRNRIVGFYLPSEGAAEI